MLKMTLAATILHLLVFSVSCPAQQPGSLFTSIPIASPNAAALGKYGDYPVSYNTGLPQISIPLYTATDGPISLPVSLSYHSAGLKVMEPASNTGAGWSLNAGGVITRSVVGAPDDRGKYTLTEKGHYADYGYNSYLFNTVSGGSSTPTCYDYPEDDFAAVDDGNFSNGHKDGEPDLFFFNFGSYSGKFYFRDDRTPVIVPEADFRIKTTLGTDSNFAAFTITTPDGVSYYFGKNQLTDGNPDAIEVTQPYTIDGGASTGTSNSAWYLNRVVSADGQFSDTLIYAQEKYSYYTLSTFPVATGDPNEKHFALVKNFLTGVRLKQINFSNGAISFAEGSVRTDLSADADQWADMSERVNTTSKTLGGITISNSYGFCKTFTFFYSYFQDNSTALPNGILSGITTDAKRLKLDSIQESSCDNVVRAGTYTFDYARRTGDAAGAYFAPRRLNFAQDHWGFYNGATGNTKLIPTYTVKNMSPTGDLSVWFTINGANRESKWPEMSYGSLNKITYPTGGGTNYTFEANEIWARYNYFTESYYSGGSVGPGHGQTSNSKPFTITNPLRHWFKFVLSYSGSRSTQSSGSATVQNTNLYVSKTYLKDSVIILSPVSSTTYTLQTGDMIESESGNLTITELTPMAYEASKTVGGLRIQNIVTYSGTTNDSLKTGYRYQTNGQSNGVLYSKPTYVQILRNDLIKTVGYALNSQNITNSNGCLTGTGNHALSYKLSPSSIRPMQSVQGSHIGYNKVEVFQSGNGWSAYDFAGTPRYGQDSGNVCTNTVNLYSCDPNLPNYPEAPLPFDYQRGNLIYERHYSESGTPLKSKAYKTDYQDNLATSTPCYLVQQGDNGGIGAMTLYTLTSAKKIRSVVTTTDFSPTGESLTTTDSVLYESMNHSQPTKEVTVMPEGDVIVKKYKYAFDYVLPACAATDNCYTSYLSSYNAAYNTYTTALGCSNSGSTCNCRWPAFQTYRYKWSEARKNYVACRKTNFVNPANNYKAAHNNGKTAADAALKPILELQDEYRNPVIETSEYRNGNLVSASYTAYDYGTGGSAYVYPDTLKSLNPATMAATFPASAISGDSKSITRDSRYENEATARYSNGNPAEMTGRDGVMQAYLWDYRNTLPVAKAVNAAAAEIAYTSFETAATGNWTVTGGSVSNAAAFTGSQCYTAGTSISRSGLNTAKSYIVSYWAQGSPMSINAGAAVSGPSKNGWTYYYHVVPAGTASVTLTGSGKTIDELRLYPADAQMTTYTYKPLTGMTSVCNPNNMVSYYEYDRLGRLARIRDIDKNILKQYSYKYQGQTASVNVPFCATTSSTYNNTSGNGYNVVMTNVNTSETVSFPIASKSSGSIMNIPSGIYNINITMASGFPFGNSFQVGNFYGTAISFSAYNVPVICPSNLPIVITN